MMKLDTGNLKLKTGGVFLTLLPMLCFAPARAHAEQQVSHAPIFSGLSLRDCAVSSVPLTNGWEYGFLTGNGNVGVIMPGNPGNEKLIESWVPDWGLNARKVYGFRGLVSNARGSNNCLLLHWGTEWPGEQCAIGLAGWMLHFFYDYYLFTGDQKFLRERFLPIAKGIALFYEDLKGFGFDPVGTTPDIIHNALIFRWNDTLDVLPALPPAWTKGSVEGLLLRGQLKVERMSWDLKAGVITLALASQINQTVTLRLPAGMEPTELLLDGKPLKDNRVVLSAGKHVSVCFVYFVVK